MEIGKSRQLTTPEILQYDLFDSLSLLDGDFSTKTQKNICVNDLENMIPESEL